MSIRRTVLCAAAFAALALCLARTGLDRPNGRTLDVSAAFADARRPNADPAGVGDLTGRFIVSGRLLPRTFISPPLPPSGRKLKDDSLLVSGGDQAIANVFVYMYPTTAIARQPTFLIQSPAGIVIYDGRMSPRALCVQTPRQVIIANSDDHLCTLRFDSGGVAPDTQIQSHESATLTLVRPGSQLPFTVDGTDVPWLHCIILVSDNPYATTTDAFGRFTIKNIPVGKWQFAVSHERRLHVSDVFVNGQRTKWEHGRFAITIRSGENSIGTVEIPADSLR